MKDLQAKTGMSIILYHPQPGCCAENLRPRVRHVRGEHRGAGRGERHLLYPHASYTRGLLASMPRIDAQEHERLIPIEERRWIFLICQGLRLRAPVRHCMKVCLTKSRPSWRWGTTAMCPPAGACDGSHGTEGGRKTDGGAKKNCSRLKTSKNISPSRAALAKSAMCRRWRTPRYIYEGETLGLVGESAAGRPPSGAQCFGSGAHKRPDHIRRRGSLQQRKEDRRAHGCPTGQKMQIIFQDPFCLLDPG